MVTTKEQATWLIEVFDKEYRGRGLRNQVIAGYLEAERILRGWDAIKPLDCTCHARNLAAEVHARYDQQKQTIDELYALQESTTTTTQKRGRKSSSI